MPKKLQGGSSLGFHTTTVRWTLWLLFLWRMNGLSTANNNECPLANGDNEEECPKKNPPQKQKQQQQQQQRLYRWIPEATHPCTIPRMTMIEFRTQFGTQGGLPPMHPYPLVIVGKSNGNEVFFQKTRSDQILNAFPPQFHVTLSSSNSFSEHRRTIPFSQYLEEISTAGAETLPDQLSNETWYFFGETYSDEWKQLLEDYELPLCVACKTNNEELVALSFGIGNRGSGVQWHVHGPGFSEAIHGRKHWVLYNEKPEFHKDQTSRNWMEYNYMSMINSNSGNDERPLECTLDPGDIIYFPDMWWHATINLDPYTAFVSTFTQEHLFVESSKTHGI